MLSTRLAETIKKLGLMPGKNTMEEAKLETTGGKTNLAREKVSEMSHTCEQDREQEG